MGTGLDRSRSAAGRQVWITGASRGIGLAAAQAFARQGDRVLLLARSGSALERAVADLRGQGLDARARELDVCDGARVQAVTAAERAAHGRPDVLVHAAGYGAQALLADQPEVAWRREIDTSVAGAVHLMQAVLPAMRAAERGVVINVGSVCGLVPTPGMATYAAAKAGLHLLTASVRRECQGSGVRLCLFVPGHTDTELGRAARFDRVPSADPHWVAQRLVEAARRAPPLFFARKGDAMLHGVYRCVPAWGEAMMAMTARWLTHRVPQPRR